MYLIDVAERNNFLKVEEIDQTDLQAINESNESCSVKFVYLAQSNKNNTSKNLLMHPFMPKLSSVIYLPKTNIIEKKLQIQANLYGFPGFC